ncbi:MAG: hypothetical protein MI684_03360 [Chlorobiales bacterium]|nr:hypothetical protein [Chlorobiales bacterium]
MLHLFSLSSFALVCCLLTFGCATDSKTPDQEQPTGEISMGILIEPCELITKTDAETLLGEPVKEPEKSEQQVVGMKLCMYNPLDEASTSFLQITLTQQAFMKPGGVPPSDIFHSIKDAQSEGRIDLEGFGDEAFIATGGLYILKDDYYISIGTGNTDLPEVQERLKSAGNVAARNLARLH